MPPKRQPSDPETGRRLIVQRVRPAGRRSYSPRKRSGCGGGLFYSIVVVIVLAAVGLIFILGLALLNPGSSGTPTSLPDDATLAAHPIETPNPTPITPALVGAIAPSAAAITESAATPLPEITAIPPLLDTLSTGIEAQVSANGGGLRLRQAPGPQGPIIALLYALTPLTILGRTADGDWLEVSTPSELSGWVTTQFVDVPVDLGQIAVTGQALGTPAPGSAGTNAQVAAGGDGLRLRQAPSTDGQIITLLGAFTPLNLVGRTADSDWLQVTIPDGISGWVVASYVDVFTSVEQVRVVSQAFGDSQATLTPTPVVGQPSVPTVPVSTAPAGAPKPMFAYITGIGPRAVEIFLKGQSLGNRANAFAAVGDSHMDNAAFLAPFDYGNYFLDGYGYLQGTLDYFAGSFSRDSAATVSGYDTGKILDPVRASKICNPGESSMACEYRLQRPAVALILLGTNDQYTWWAFEGHYREIIEYSIAQGIVPVLFTKADDFENGHGAASGLINATIVRLGSEYQVPVANLRQAVETLPNRGLADDGIHFRLPPDGQSATFTSDHLIYGYNMFNLVAMHALDAIRRQVIGR